MLKFGGKFIKSQKDVSKNVLNNEYTVFYLLWTCMHVPVRTYPVVYYTLPMMIFSGRLRQPLGFPPLPPPLSPPLPSFS